MDPAPAPAPARRRAWLRTTVDRVPTRWFAMLGTLVFLAGTAAFGGLATAATPPVPELAPGEPHVSAQFAITVERAVLLDEFPEAGITVDEGERVLAVLVEVENRWTEPLKSSASALDAVLRVDGVEGPARSYALYDDATQLPYLQPGVPEDVVVTWGVPADAVTDGQTIEVTIRDQRLVEGWLLIGGRYWTDPTDAAVVPVEVADVGAGAAS